MILKGDNYTHPPINCDSCVASTIKLVTNGLTHQIDTKQNRKTPYSPDVPRIRSST